MSANDCITDILNRDEIVEILRRSTDLNKIVEKNRLLSR